MVMNVAGNQLAENMQEIVDIFKFLFQIFNSGIWASFTDKKVQPHVSHRILKVFIGTERMDVQS
jgi:hypothetical protein